MATEISPIPEYTGTAPSRGQSQSAFNTNVADSLAFSLGLPEEINTFAEQANTLAAETEANAASAANSESNALTYKNMAAASANFQGLWENLTGPRTTTDVENGVAAGHLGALWFLVEPTTDITLDEPGVSSKWEKFVGGWDNQTTSVIAYPNSPLSLKVTSAAVVTIANTFVIGDEFSIHNSSRSTADITLVNADYDISGPISEATAGTDITIKAGQTLKMQAESLTEFEIV